MLQSNADDYSFHSSIRDYPQGSSQSSLPLQYRTNHSSHPYYPDNGYISEATVMSDHHSHSSSPAHASQTHSASTSSLPLRGRPIPIANQEDEARLVRMLQSNPTVNPPNPIPSLADIPSPPKWGGILPTRKGSKSKQSPHSEDDHTQTYQNAKSALAALPPYLKPDFGEMYLRLDHDGIVKSGTLEALVERLTVDHLSELPMFLPTLFFVSLIFCGGPFPYFIFFRATV